MSLLGEPIAALRYKSPRCLTTLVEVLPRYESFYMRCCSQVTIDALLNYISNPFKATTAMIFTNQLKLRVTVTKAEPSGLRTNGPAPCFVFLPTVSPTVISSQRVENVCEANMSGASYKVNQVHDPAVC